MRNSIHPGTSCYARRLRKSESRIKNCNARGGLRIKARHFFVCFFVNDERRGLAFTAGSSSRGDGDEWQHRFAGLADAPVILHASTVHQKKVASFGGIHRAAAAE